MDRIQNYHLLEVTLVFFLDHHQYTKFAPHFYAFDINSLGI